MNPDLKPNLSSGGQIVPLETSGWRLEIPSGRSKRYRLAQLDDYSDTVRRLFPWQPPLHVSLQARSSAQNILGTWGFGLWNDPFSMGVLSGAHALRLPTLPQAAWFFFASPPSYLSLRDDLPAQGGLAATFHSLHHSALTLSLGALALPSLFLPPAARQLRRLGRRLIHQDAAALALDPTDWHTYTLEWTADTVCLLVDGTTVLQTAIVPRGPLGLVIWIDNQYAAAPPNGRLRYGMLPSEAPAWIEVSNLCLTRDVHMGKIGGA